MYLFLTEVSIFVHNSLNMENRRGQQKIIITIKQGYEKAGTDTQWLIKPCQCYLKAETDKTPMQIQLESYQNLHLLCTLA